MSSDKPIHADVENIEIRNSKGGSIFWLVMCFLCALASSKLYWGNEERHIEYLVLFIFLLLGIIFFYWQYKDRSVWLLITKEGIWSYKEFYSWKDIEDVKAESDQFADNTAQYNLVITFKSNSKKKQKKKIDVMNADKELEEIDEIVKSYFEMYKKGVEEEK